MAIVIVGAGLCGLWMARQLAEAGVKDIAVVDKSRGVGGRMATRRTDAAKFDHGAQFYSVKPPIEALHRRWEKSQLVRSWLLEGVTSRMAAPGGMTTLAKDLAQGLDVRLDQKAARIDKQASGWSVRLESSLGPTSEIAAQTLILTCPLPQSLDLLQNSNLMFDPELRSVQYAKALVALYEDVVASGGLEGESGYAEPQGSSIFSVSDQRSKGVSSTRAWTVTMGAEFSETFFGDSESNILRSITEEVRRLDPSFTFGKAQIKSWRFSHPLQTIARPEPWVEVEPKLFLAGDAFGGPSLNGAARSASMLAAKLLREFGS